jgi:hypothetical protein
MAVLAPMKDTTPGIRGVEIFLNEPPAIRSEPSFGLKFGFLQKRKGGSVFTVEILRCQYYL